MEIGALLVRAPAALHTGAIERMEYEEESEPEHPERLEMEAAEVDASYDARYDPDELHDHPDFKFNTCIL